MRSALLHDLAAVAFRDADAIADQHAWPPKTLDSEERRERDRLDAVGRTLRYEAICAEYEEQEDARAARLGTRRESWYAARHWFSFHGGGR